MTGVFFFGSLFLPPILNEVGDIGKEGEAHQGLQDAIIIVSNVDIMSILMCGFLFCWVVQRIK